MAPLCSCLCVFCDVLIVELGLWVCGESWLAIKDCLTHCPSSQSWAPGVLLFVFSALCCFVRQALTTNCKCSGEWATNLKLVLYQCCYSWGLPKEKMSETSSLIPRLSPRVFLSVEVTGVKGHQIIAPTARGPGDEAMKQV